MESAKIGPEVPPESVDGLKVENKDQSALKESIKKKGGNSYYYAHNYDGQNFNDENAKTFYGDGLIYGGEPTLVETRESTSKAVKKVETPVKKIAKYSWLDEESKVKIYIDLAQFPTQITKEMIEVKFDEYLCDIKVVDEDGTQHVLNVSKLHEKIIPDKSSWRHSEKRISITMKKWLETSWSELIKGSNK